MNTSRSQNYNPETEAMAFMDSYRTSFAAMELTKRNIPQLIGEEERDVRDLAALAGVDVRALEAMLRLLSGHGYFRESTSKPGVFSNTELSKALQTCRPYAEFFSHATVQDVWAQLGHCLETGESAIQKRFGESSFVIYAIHKEPELAGHFFRMLELRGSFEVPALMEAYDFSQRRGVMDVGGATGDLLLAIAERYPMLEQYVLFDLPHMVESPKAREAISRLPSGRAKAISGDASTSLPRIEGIDTITHKYFLHDFDDERALTFLKNDHRALPEGGKVLIMELISRPGSNQPRYSNEMDLVMLVNEGGGYVRSVEKHEENLKKAGFRLEREIETSMDISVLEAVKQ